MSCFSLNYVNEAADIAKVAVRQTKSENVQEKVEMNDPIC